MLLSLQLREEGGPKALAELVAMDAQGCFVDDGDEEEEEACEEEEGDEEEMEDGGEGSSHGKVRHMHTPFHTWGWAFDYFIFLLL